MLHLQQGPQPAWVTQVFQLRSVVEFHRAVPASFSAKLLQFLLDPRPLDVRRNRPSLQSRTDALTGLDLSIDAKHPDLEDDRLGHGSVELKKWKKCWDVQFFSVEGVKFCLGSDRLFSRCLQFAVCFLRTTATCRPKNAPVANEVVHLSRRAMTAGVFCVFHTLHLDLLLFLLVTSLNLNCELNVNSHGERPCLAAFSSSVAQLLGHEGYGGHNQKVQGVVRKKSGTSKKLPKSFIEVESFYFGSLPCLDTHSCWTVRYGSKLDTPKFCQFPNPDDQNDSKSMVTPRS